MERYDWSIITYRAVSRAGRFARDVSHEMGAKHPQVPFDIIYI